MNKRLFALSFALTGFILAHAQMPDQIINVQDVSRIEKTLSADEMEGRKIFTPGIEKAASFIESEFAKTGLGYLDGLKSYRQEFGMIQQKSIEISGDIDGKPLEPQWVAALGSEAELTVNEQSGFNQVYIDSLPNLFRGLSPILSSGKPTVVWLSEKNKNSFRQLGFFSRRPMMEGAVPVIFVLHEKPEKFSIAIKREIEKQPLTNIVGVIPGKSKKDEYVVFSAHYDHLGFGKPDAKGDSLYNGANDDASGTTAVIMLAKYFKALNDNERTLIFVAFTAEESGGYGSRYFSQQLNPDKVVAMFNIEMIGTDSKWGTNSAYITGYEKTDFGQILQKNLEGSKFRFEPDPYPEQNLFMRSDNATLAALGVPAHTISTSKMDNEPHYHKQSDEFETLDMNNMTEVIKGIALSSKSIISGKDTPTRVKQD
ncbi:MAG TPA: M20/M25/M40 family metallo-hydrolase [Ginsengibacter sp.]|nr:M20/M25/M40 family metallo-hydrolase [Ginsengibacter sp.]HRP44678.1 M20/M25/M40 family metallo-hydrolase [Ginsengibacter sp.]